MSNLSTDYVEPVNRSKKMLNAVVTDKNRGDVSVEDFLQLMVAQLKNQDFMNPVQDTEYVTQLAQFATMTQMQEMAALSQNTYAASLAGKSVTVARFTVGGDVDKEIGTVQKVSLVNNEYLVYVNDKSYSLDQIMEINDSNEVKIDTAKKEITAKFNEDGSLNLKWLKATSNAEIAPKLEYAVYYSSDEAFDTVGEVENGSSARDYIKDSTEANLSGLGLKPGDTYYFNVVAKDEQGVKYVYKKVKVEAK